jgi:hypothetical protein
LTRRALITSDNETSSIGFGIVIGLSAFTILFGLVLRRRRSRSKKTVLSEDSYHAPWNQEDRTAPASAHIEFVEEQPNSVAEGQPPENASEETQRQFAELRGEVHRLRAELILRDSEREEMDREERQPTYQNSVFSCAQ